MNRFPVVMLLVACAGTVLVQGLAAQDRISSNAETRQEAEISNEDWVAVRRNIALLEMKLNDLELNVRVPVSFYVQRASVFSGRNTPIPFDKAVLNVGGAMNIATGIFTVPRNGIYFFSFSGITSAGSLLHIGLYVNDNKIGSANAETNYATLTLQSTLQLNAGDKVSVRNFENVGSLHDDVNRYSHFTGFAIN